MKTSKTLTRSNQGFSGALTTTLIIASALIALITIIACARVNSREIKNRNSVPEAIPPLVGSDELAIELTSSGFVPAEITHAAGPFGISVENSSDANNFTLRLKSQDGTVLKEIPVQKGSVAWSVNLSPGQYTLTEANHEQWICVITVQ